VQRVDINRPGNGQQFGQWVWRVLAMSDNCVGRSSRIWFSAMSWEPRLALQHSLKSFRRSGRTNSECVVPQGLLVMIFSAVVVAYISIASQSIMNICFQPEPSAITSSPERILKPIFFKHRWCPS
jgi:hypothetical protein